MRGSFTKLLVAAGVVSLACAADSPVPVGRMTWVVRADAHGRLVRRLVPSAVQPTEAATPSKPAAKRVIPKEITEIVELTADKHGIDPLLVHSVISVESNYNPFAQSPKGAQGLMQLIPSTARQYGAQNSFDTRENIEAGVKYLKHLQGMYKDDLSLTLAAYNAGEGAVAKYKNAIPPYRETLDYVKKVGQRYEDARRQKPATQAANTASTTPAPPPVEEFRHIETVIDDQGRLYVRTR